MSKTLRFGFAEARLSSRIDRNVIRRRTPDGYDRAAEAAYAAFVAQQVTPSIAGRPTVSFRSDAPRFGKRGVK